MKEQLSFNMLDGNREAGWVGTHKNSETIGLKIADYSHQKSPADEINNPESNDVVDAKTRGADAFDQSAIDGMDFAMAMESLKFINEQALLPEGRKMMSQAHNEISPKQVMQLFGSST